MTKRSLLRLLDLRCIAVAEAKAAFASALAEEQAASATESSVTTSIERELKAAAADAADDKNVEAIAVWLPQARMRQSDARHRRHAAEVATSKRRAALSAAKNAERAIENLVKAKAAEAHVEVERQAQSDLDEFALGRSKNKTT